MLEGSVDVIRELVLEAMGSPSERDNSLSESSEFTPMPGVSVAALASLIPIERESRGELEIRARNVVSKMCIASFLIDRNDARSLRMGSSYSHVYGGSYEHEGDINLIAKLTEMNSFKSISETIPGGYRILSLGEIWQKTETHNGVYVGQAERVEAYSVLLNAKLACLSRIISTIDEVGKRKVLERSLNRIYDKHQAEGTQPDQEEIDRAKRDAESRISKSNISYGLEEARSQINKMKSVLGAWAIAALAAQGRVIDSQSGKVKRVKSADEALAALREHENFPAISRFNTIMRDAPVRERGVITKGRAAAEDPNAAMGPMYRAVLSSTETMLNGMGFGEQRALTGKGLTRYTVNPDGSVKNAMGLPVEMIEQIGITAAIEEQDKVVGGMFPRGSSAETTSLIKSAVSDSDQKTLIGSIAAQRELNAEKQRAAAELGVTTQTTGRETDESKFRTDLFIKPLTLINLSLKGSDQVRGSARWSPIPGTKDEQWIAIAYKSFAGALATAIQDARFSNTKALADLCGNREIKAAEITAAAIGRPSATSLKRVGPTSGDAQGMKSFDRLISVFTYERADQLALLLNPNKEEEKKAKEWDPTNVPKEVFEQVAGAAKSARRVQDAILSESLVSAYQSLKRVVTLASRERKNPGLVDKIAVAHEGLGGRISVLITDIASGKDVQDIMSYVAGSAVEPIREQDVDALEQTASAYHEAARDIESSTAASAIRRSGESPEEQSAAMEKLKMKRAADIASPEETIAREERPNRFVGTVSPALQDIDESRLLEGLRRVLIARASSGLNR